MRLKIIACAVAAAIPLLGFSALAHHSFAPHFDASKPVDISGTVISYEARNPHSYLHVSALDENGRTREYVCESHGVTQLSRIGITPQLFKAGTKVRVAGSLSRHSPYMCFFTSVEFSDGRKSSVDGPADAPKAAPLAPRKDIFGAWLLAPIPNRSTSGAQPMMQQLTPAGQKAVAVYDPFRDDPTFRCDPVGIRRAWGAPSTPMEIVQSGSDIVLHHEWMDVRRVVHMNLKTHPKDSKPNSLGHSMGHWEGTTLVIETANYPVGVLSQYVEQPGQPTRGMLHSAALTTVERIHLDSARQRIVVEIDMQDPEFYKAAFPRVTYEYAASGLKIEPFKCTPEGLNGTARNAAK